MAKKSAVRIFSAETIQDIEEQIEYVLNRNKDFYIQSISISHDETWVYAAVVFNIETEDKSK
jgi:hypothetical protein